MKAKRPKKKSARKRARRGSGSVYYHAGRDLWVASVSLGTDVDGRRKRLSVYAQSESEAWKKLEDERIRSGGRYRSRSPETVSNYLRVWLEDIKQRRKATTAATYATALNHILPLAIMQKKMSDFDKADVRRIYDHLEATGITPSVRHKAHVALHAAFEVAVQDDVVTRNPFDHMAPKYEAAAMKSFTPEQAQRFLRACAGDRLEALFVIALAAGIRQGELLALKWEDVDWNGKRLAVRRNLQEVASKLEIVSPKTGKGRSVAIGPLIIEALHNRKTIAAREKHRSPFIFTTPTGQWIRKANLRRRVFEPLLVKAKVPRVRFHDLRHSAATLMLGSNINPKIVSEMLGHSRVGVTLDVYSHALPTLQAAAAETVSSVLDAGKRNTGSRRR